MQNLTLVLVGFFSILVFISLILLVIYILAYWFIFSKAGEPGWKALIPFYSTYTVFKLTWNTKMFALYMGLFVITNILVWIGGSCCCCQLFVFFGNHGCIYSKLRKFGTVIWQRPWIYYRPGVPESHFPADSGL